MGYVSNGISGVSYREPANFGWVESSFDLFPPISLHVVTFAILASQFLSIEPSSLSFLHFLLRTLRSFFFYGSSDSHLPQKLSILWNCQIVNLYLFLVRSFLPLSCPLFSRSLTTRSLMTSVIQILYEQRRNSGHSSGFFYMPTAVSCVPVRCTFTGRKMFELRGELKETI